MTAPPAPDRARGVFETLLVLDGSPLQLDAHLARLAASLEALFGVGPPEDLEYEAGAAVAGLSLGRLRIDVRPGAGRPRATLASEPVDAADFFPAWERGAALRTLPCEGGLGPHKWADRRRLETVARDELPLLLDRGEKVLEASRANVFAVREETLLTPSLDGRLLPGTARAGAIAAAREAGIPVLERTLRRGDLLAADEVFLTGSVRGIEPARSLDGVPLPPPTALSRRVGAGLRRRWLAGRGASAAPALAGGPPPGPPVR